MTILQGDRKHATGEWVDVTAAKKARLWAALVSGDATAAILSIEESADGIDNGVVGSTTLGSITAAGVDTDPFTVDGVNFIRVRVTTPSTNDSMIAVKIGVQQEV